jgi:hypothetical protein
VLEACGDAVASGVEVAVIVAGVVGVAVIGGGRDGFGEGLVVGDALAVAFAVAVAVGVFEAVAVAVAVGVAVAVTVAVGVEVAVAVAVAVGVEVAVAVGVGRNQVIGVFAEIRFAVAPARACVISPVAVNLPVAGSKSSALASGL